ncbi:hypothetical protein D3C73_894300 [compost metagenome]
MPQGDKTFVFRRHDVRFNLEEVLRDKIFNIFVTPDDQPQHRCLHPAHRQHAIITGITPQNGVGTGHVDAIQPVGAGTRQGGDTKWDKVAIVTQPFDSALHRLRVEIVDQATADAVAFFRRQRQIVQHLIHQQLAFPVRVTGMHHFIGLVQQLFDGIKLFADRRPWLQLPLFGDDRQIGQRPARITAVVSIRLRLF